MITRQEETKGTIEHIKFFNDSFLIAALDTGLTVKGSMLEPQEGIEYTFQGKLETHSKYGKQFNFTSYQTNFPTSKGTVLYYLSRNAIWIGPRVAERVWDVYEADSLKVLKESPERVAKEIKGMTLKRAKQTSEMLLSNEVNERAILELKEVIGDAKVGQNQINQIIEHWRHEAASYIRKYPYSLPDIINGIGFHTADEIAYRLGYDRNGDPRIEAGILHCLKEAQRNGHVCLSVNVLLSDAVKLLRVERDRLNDVIVSMCLGGEKGPKVILDNDYIYLKPAFDDEIYIANRIKAMMQAVPGVYPDPSIGDDGLFEDQKEAIKKIREGNVFILTGSPGTGKSHLIKRIINLYKGHSVELCCPTGKGAKRMTELSGYPARTIHSLLEPFPIKGGMQFQRNEANPLEAQVVIVDEVSMMDNWLTASLLRAIKGGTRLILVGDTNQLPAVGAGNVLRELIDSEVVPFVELTEIKRQEPGLIISNCHKIKDGIRELEYSGATDFLFVDAQDPTEIQGWIEDLLGVIHENDFIYDTEVGQYFKPLGPLNVLRDIQVISPLREKTDLSVKALNIQLQKLLNPKARFKGKKSKHGYSFFEGDKVIQRKNEYDLGIINGDMGSVMGLDYERKDIMVKFENPERLVDLPMNDNNLELAYAITAHSFQGSEAPVIVIPIHSSFGGLIMQRNWLYTAISRAQKLCILVGQREEIPKIIGRSNQQLRYTQLAGKVNPELDEGW